MAPLVTLSEYEAVTGSCADPGRTSVLLGLASDAVRSAAGGQIISAATSEDVELRNWEGVFYFPQRPVRAVTSVTIGGVLVDPAGYRWTAGGYGRHAALIAVDSTGRDVDWSAPVAVVTYDHGWLTVPGALVTMVASMVRGVTDGGGGGTVTSRSIEGYSETIEGAPPADMSVSGPVRSLITELCGAPRFGSLPILKG